MTLRLQHFFLYILATLCFAGRTHAALIGQWTFETDASDATGHFAVGAPANGATVANGRLNVNAASGQFLKTGPYTGAPISAKTLVAWVYVTDLNARAGSVLTLERSDGTDTFDGIIYAEREPFRWMAGSDNFTRTADFGGTNETSNASTLVQIAIVYGDPVAGNNQNRITCYRNGVPYGNSYVQNSRITYSTGTVDVMFGKRHDDTGGVAFFTGGIEEARIYDTAMTQAEIAALSLAPSTEPPEVTQDPQNLSIPEGSNASFSVGLKNAVGATYQWRRNLQPINGATNGTYSFGPVSIAGDNGAKFDCVVTNGFGNDTSAQATLTVTVPPPPNLVGQWTFETDTSDATGHFAVGTLFGGATVSEGRLNVNANAFQYLQTGAYTGPTVTAKTLVAWVYVGDLAARAGSVLTIERSAGVDVFDGIIFAEREDRRWMPGSDGFNRTQDVGGPAEDAAPDALVQMAIVYGDPTLTNDQNRITIYRNGVPYGTSYTSTPRATYSTGVDAIFGRRHEESGQPCYFTGGIEEARIYDAALNAGQISALKPEGFGPPAFSDQPDNTQATEGQTATFSVTMVRPATVTYQWRRNQQPIQGATAASYTVGPLTIANDNGAVFDCVATSPFGTITSDPATLTVTPDLTPPTIVSISHIGDPGVIVVTFSEAVEIASAQVAGNYTVAGLTVQSAQLSGDGKVVTLRVSGMTAGASYTVKVSGVRDRATSPNTIAAGAQQSFSFTYTPLSVDFLRPRSETPGLSTRNTGVSVSEVHYHPAPRADGKNTRFIELFNANPWSEDLSGWKLTGDVEFLFPTGTTIFPRSYLVIAAVPADVESVYGIGGVLGPLTGTIGQEDGVLRLRTNFGAILYDGGFSSKAPWPVGPNGFGPSLVLARGSYGQADPRAWAASRLTGGSPGAAEPGFVADALDGILINELGAGVGFVELFNYSSDPANLGGCVITDGTHAYVIPNGTSIPSLGQLSFSATTLGFSPTATAGAMAVCAPNNARVLDAVRYTGLPADLSVGRAPDGAAEFSLLQSRTPGTSNTARKISNVVLNELQYHPISDNSDDEFVELRNTSAIVADIGGWRLRGEVDYNFPAGTTIPAGGYLVIARNKTHLLTVYPTLNSTNTVGDYSGSLSNAGGRVSLLSTPGGGVFLTVDEVIYGTGGRWGKWSDGDGSTLERVDPRADAHFPSAWADSNETAKSGWVTVQTTGVMDNGRDAATALEIVLQGAGECLVDEVEVNAGGGNLVANSSFESGVAGWVFQGTHDASGPELNEGSSGSRSLHLRADDSGDPSNRAFTLLTSAPAAGQTVTLRAKVRWLAGSPLIRLRLRGNWLEANGSLLTTATFGTPGAANSRGATNVGPAITEVKHFPVLPVAQEAVTVTARISDPDPLASLALKYRLDPSANVVTVAMAYRGAGLYSATIPGQANGDLVAFYIEAGDSGTPAQVTRFPADAPVREALVRWGATNEPGAFPSYNMWMTKATFDRWSANTKMSNSPLDITFAYRGDRVIYNAGGMFAGSPFHSLGKFSPGTYDTPIGHWCDYDLVFPKDDLLFGTNTTKLSWPGNTADDPTGQREQAGYWTSEQMGLPFCPRQFVHLFVNGTRRAAIFEDVVQVSKEMLAAFYDGNSDGALHKVQLWFEYNDPVTDYTFGDAQLANWFTTGGQRKLARYRVNWPRRAAGNMVNDFTDLYAMMDAATTSATGAAYTAAIEAQIDVEQWMRVIALEHIIQNGDSFGNDSLGQNMYAYHPPGSKWVLIPWDIDYAYVGNTGQDIFSIKDTFLVKMANHPPFRRHLWRAYADAANGPLNAGTFGNRVDSRYSGLLANNAAVTSPNGLKDNAAARRNFILNQLTSVAASFTASCPASSASAAIQISGTAPIEARTILVNGVAVVPVWSALTSWSAPFVLHSGANALEVRAYNTAGALVGAQNLSSTYTGSTQWAGLKINEWMASNNGAVIDPADGDADDWFELYNPTASAVNLTGWTLTDIAATPALFVIPAGYTIPAGGRLLVWADEETAQNTGSGSLHVNFKLSAAGERLALYAPDQTLIDEITFGAQAQNIAEGRIPDGGNVVGLLAVPTPGTANAAVAPIPTITAAARTGNTFQLSFSTLPFYSYRVEYTTDLLLPWLPLLDEDLPGNGAVQSITDDVSGIPKRFYRVRRVP